MRPALVDGRPVGVGDGRTGRARRRSACSRRSRPMGSLRTVGGQGPTVTMPRARPGMSSGCAMAWPARSSGTRELDQPGARPATSMRPGSATRWPWLRTTIAPVDAVAGDDALVREREVDVVRRGRRTGTARSATSRTRTPTPRDHALHPAERDAEHQAGRGRDDRQHAGGRTVRAEPLPARVEIASRPRARHAARPPRRPRARARPGAAPALVAVPLGVDGQVRAALGPGGRQRAGDARLERAGSPLGRSGGSYRFASRRAAPRRAAPGRPRPPG